MKIVMDFCNYSKIMMVYLHMQNGKYGPIVHEKWDIWCFFSMRKPSTIHNSNIQDSNKTLEEMFLISYKNIRFLVALNTLDKFFGRHA